MNRRMVFYMIGQIIKLEAALLLFPVLVSLFFRERCLWSFLITAGIAVVFGFGLTLLFKPKDKLIYAKEGFVIVAFAWLLLSALGALPFFLSGEIPSYIDAFFETVRGFTTTGASILRSPEPLSRGLLFWRSFTHWIGGMGVLVLIMAIMPNDSGRSIHILRAEIPGPIVGKLVPKIRETAKILYLIYVAMTVAEIIFLLCGGMSPFESVVHTFGTAGTGGFSTRVDSIAGYSPYLQNVITIFMLLFGINFNLYFLLLVRHFRSVFKSAELWCYIGLFAGSVGVITANIYPLYRNFSESLRLSAFQVSSIMTTTGYATADFNLWPDLSKSILFFLMFVGACAGSTAGGLKISRILLLFKIMRRELKRLLHPRSVGTVHFEGKTVSDATLSSVGSYFILYAVVLVFSFLLLSFEPFGLETNLSAVVACFNNVGPGLGGVGPAACYADYSAFSKMVLSFAMLFGRLEIYPILFALSPSTWTRK